MAQELSENALGDSEDRCSIQLSYGRTLIRRDPGYYASFAARSKQMGEGKPRLLGAVASPAGSSGCRCAVGKSYGVFAIRGYDCGASQRLVPLSAPLDSADWRACSRASAFRARAKSGLIRSACCKCPIASGILPACPKATPRLQCASA